MFTTDVEARKKEEKYLFTIRDIRARNFDKGLPFLMLSGDLPEGQVYREYADGRIELQEVFFVGPKFQCKVLRELTATEANKVRKANGLL